MSAEISQNKPTIDDTQQVPSNERKSVVQDHTMPQAATDDTESGQVANPTSDVEPGNELTRADTGPPYSIFKPWQKKVIVFSASLGAVFSPMSTTIYLPALNSIASDLHVSNTKINLTVTTFLVSSSQ